MCLNKADCQESESYADEKPTFLKGVLYLNWVKHDFLNLIVDYPLPNLKLLVEDNLEL